MTVDEARVPVVVDVDMFSKLDESGTDKDADLSFRIGIDPDGDESESSHWPRW